VRQVAGVEDLRDELNGETVHKWRVGKESGGNVAIV
jgi:hypothetical protein